MAVAIAKDLARESGRPIPLPLAASLLPLVAAQRTEEYDAWALRWLVRWASEASAPTIELAAEVAATLADLPDEPAAASALQKACP